MDASGIAVVTGASRGIGRAVAIELARRGFDVVATMRDPSAGADLPELASRDGSRGSLAVSALDVTRPETIEFREGLRVLVNNAGTEREKLPVELAPMDLYRELFETNVFGLIETTRRAIPFLRASGGGVICNITSSSLFAPVPFYAAYRASKAAVSAFGETLRTEVAQFGIRVVEIMPGPIRTDMYTYSEQPPEALAHEAYQPMAEHMHASRAGISHLVTPPEDAATAIAEAILDDDGPLRYGCDPLSLGLLERWRASSDEEMLRTMGAGFTSTRSTRET